MHPRRFWKRLGLPKKLQYTWTRHKQLLARRQTGGNRNQNNHTSSHNKIKSKDDKPATDIRAGSTATLPHNNSRRKQEKDSMKNPTETNQEWQETILQIRETVWESQQEIGTALQNLRNRSLTLDEEEGEYDFDYEDDVLVDLDVVPKDSGGANPSSINVQIAPPLDTDTIHTIQNIQASLHKIGSAMESMWVERTTLQHLDGWAICALVSALILACSLRCYELLSRDWHWDFDWDMVTDFDLYPLLAYVEPGLELLSLVVSALGMISSLHAGCIFSLLTAYGRTILGSQEQRQERFSQYPCPQQQAQPLLLGSSIDLQKNTLNLQRKGYRSFRVSFYMLGMQLLLLIPSRLPSVLQRSFLFGLLLFMVKVRWDLKTIRQPDRKRSQKANQTQQQSTTTKEFDPSI